MKPDFTFGSFTWFIGKVEDIMDEKMLGRIKVRVYGYHDDSISKDDLPWASVMGPIQSASSQSVGYSPTGIREGTTVIGFFLDGESAQVPLVIGTLYGEPGENDVHPASREINNSKKTPWGAGELQHPGTTFAAKYPDNHTIAGHSGLLIEVDNTEGANRLSWETPAGTWMETDHDGNYVLHIKKDMFTGVEQNNVVIIAKNNDVYIGGESNVHIVGNAKLKIDKNYEVTVGGNYTLNVAGNRTVIVGGQTTETSSGEHIMQASIIRLN